MLYHDRLSYQDRMNSLIVIICNTLQPNNHYKVLTMSYNSTTKYTRNYTTKYREPINLVSYTRSLMCEPFSIQIWDFLVDSSHFLHLKMSSLHLNYTLHIKHHTQLDQKYTLLQRYYPNMSNDLQNSCPRGNKAHAKCKCNMSSDIKNWNSTLPKLQLVKCPDYKEILGLECREKIHIEYTILFKIRKLAI